MRMEDTKQLLDVARRFTSAEPGPEKDQAELELRAVVKKTDRVIALRIDLTCPVQQQQGTVPAP